MITVAIKICSSVNDAALNDFLSEAKLMMY